MKDTSDKAPTENEIAVQYTDIYNTKDFGRYNPDGLMIKKGDKTYKRMMHDEQVKAVLQFKKYAIVSRNYYFDIEVDENGVENEQHKEIADFFNTVIDRIQGNFTDKLIGMLSALNNGYSVNEKVYTTFDYDGRAYWGIKDIKTKPFETFDGGFNVDPYGNIHSINQVNAGITEREIPTDKVIHFVYQPDIDNVYGESDLRACYRAWWSKDITIRFLNIFLERSAGGMPVFKRQGKMSSGENTALKNIANRFMAMTSLILPPKLELEWHDPKSNDMYEKAIVIYDKAIAKSILVPNLLGLSEQGSTGSYAQSQTQIEAFFWVATAVANSLAETINEQMFRELAVINFGTEDYPKFKFDQLTDQSKIQLADTWGNLVQKNAVTKSDTDESYIRRLLNFPEQEEAEVEDGQAGTSELDPSKTLNGAQVTALLSIVEQLSSGQIDRATAVKIIAASFPLTETEAARLLETIQAGDIPEELPELPDNEPFIDKYSDPEALRVILAEKPWLTRINFTEQENSMDTQDEQFGTSLSTVMVDVRDSLIKQVVKVGGKLSWGNVNPKEVENITIPKKVLSDMRKIIRANLNDTVEVSYGLAKDEIPKKGFKVSGGVMDKTSAERFLSSKAVGETKVISTDVLTDVKRILEQAITYDYSLRETISTLESSTKLAEMIPKTDAAGRAVNIPARIETITRTLNSQAWNQARTSLFNQPELKGFIQSFEYSAILDNRTSEICNTNDGRIRVDWGSWTPPNHYNCRSLLSAVTTIDEWNGKQDALTQSGQPLEGFGQRLK